MVVEACDSRGRPLKDLKRAMREALEKQADGCIILHKRILVREFRLRPRTEQPSIQLRTPVRALITSTKFVANGTDAAAHFSVNVSSSFSIRALPTFFSTQRPTVPPPDPSKLLPLPVDAPARPPLLTVEFGVLPARRGPARRFRRLPSLKRDAMGRPQKRSRMAAAGSEGASQEAPPRRFLSRVAALRPRPVALWRRVFKRRSAEDDDFEEEEASSEDGEGSEEEEEEDDD